MDRRMSSFHQGCERPWAAFACFAAQTSLLIQGKGVDRHAHVSPYALTRPGEVATPVGTPKSRIATRPGAGAHALRASR